MPVAFFRLRGAPGVAMPLCSTRPILAERKRTLQCSSATTIRLPPLSTATTRPVGAPRGPGRVGDDRAVVHEANAAAVPARREQRVLTHQPPHAPAAGADILPDLQAGPVLAITLASEPRGRQVSSSRRQQGRIGELGPRAVSADAPPPRAARLEFEGRRIQAAHRAPSDRTCSPAERKSRTHLEFVLARTAPEPAWTGPGSRMEPPRAPFAAPSPWD